MTGKNPLSLDLSRLKYHTCLRLCTSALLICHIGCLWTVAHNIRTLIIPSINVLFMLRSQQHVPGIILMLTHSHLLMQQGMFILRDEAGCCIPKSNSWPGPKFFTALWPLYKKNSMGRLTDSLSFIIEHFDLIYQQTVMYWLCRFLILQFSVSTGQHLVLRVYRAEFPSIPGSQTTLEMLYLNLYFGTDQEYINSCNTGYIEVYVLIKAFEIMRKTWSQTVWQPFDSYITYCNAKPV